MGEMKQGKLELVKDSKALIESMGYIVEEKANGHLKIDFCNYWATSSKWYDEHNKVRGKGMNSFLQHISSVLKIETEEYGLDIKDAFSYMDHNKNGLCICDDNDKYVYSVANGEMYYSRLYEDDPDCLFWKECQMTSGLMFGNWKKVR